MLNKQVFYITTNEKINVNSIYYGERGIVYLHYIEH